MPQDQTDAVDLESRLSQSQALSAALDDDHDQIDLLDDGGDEPQRTKASDLHDSLSRGQHSDDDDDVDYGDVDDPLASLEPDPVQAPASTDAGLTDDDKLQQAIFERARKAGFAADKYRNVDDLFSGVASLASKLGQRDEMAAYGQLLLNDPLKVYEHLQSVLKQQGKIKDEQQAPAPAVVKSDVPEYDEAWEELVDENGQPKQGADPKAIAGLRKYREWQRKRSAELLRDPASVVKPKLEDDFRKLAESMINEKLGKVLGERDEQQRLAQYQQQQAAIAQQIFNEESPWVYADKADPSKGLSPAGKIFQKYVAYYESVDPMTGMPRMTDMREIRDAAKARTHVELTELAKKNGGRQQAKPTPAVAPKGNARRTAPASKRTPAQLNVKDLEKALLAGLSR